MKTCKGCNQMLALNLFYKDKHGALGVKSKCKECIEKMKKIYRLKNKEKIREADKLYWQKTKNQERPGKKAADKKWRDSNIEKNRARNRLYRKNNSKRINEKARNRYHDIAQVKFSRCLRSRIRDALQHNRKSSSSEKLIGCTFAELKQHLQAQFQEGMIWKNYGSEWHIDHKDPCVMFDLSIASEQAKCFHWTNLQPLWKSENLRKGGTFEADNDTLSCVYLLFE